MHVQFAPLQRLPVIFLCRLDGTITLLPAFGPGFRGVVDVGEGVQATFLPETFSFTDSTGTEEFPYGSPIRYKSSHRFLQWLIQQQLQNPYQP